MHHTKLIIGSQNALQHDCSNQKFKVTGEQCVLKIKARNTDYLMKTLLDLMVLKRNATVASMKLVVIRL